METLLAVGLIVGFIYFHSRISTLENKLSQYKGVEPVPKAHPPLHPQTTVTPIAVTSVAPLPKPASVETIGFDEASGGKWLGRLGIGAIFVGVAFFLKYAFDTNLIGIIGRVLIGVLTGTIFVCSGQYLRKKYEQYAYLLVGGGIAILYLSFYAAYNLFHLISQPMALFLMICVTALTIALSVVDTSLPLAVLAVAGGFGTPYFLSSGENDPVTLFTYIAILNVAVVTLATRKNWSILPMLGFIATYLQYGLWYSVFYTSLQLPVAFFFLSLFFFIFLILPAGYIMLGAKKTRVEDLILASINPFMYFAAASMLLFNMHYESLWVLALTLAGVYSALAGISYFFNKEDSLFYNFAGGIAIIFVTIAIPLKLKHSWIALAWLCESVLLYAIAFIYAYSTLEFFGLSTFLLGCVGVFFEYLQKSSYVQVQPFFNHYAALFLVAIGVAYYVSYLYAKYPDNTKEKNHPVIAVAYFVVANILSIYILTSETTALYAAQLSSYASYYNFDAMQDILNQRNTVISVLWTAYAVALVVVGFVAKVRIARILGHIFFFITACKIFIDVWSLGEIYRIIASIIFGAVALLASFLYVKYSQRIKEMVL